MTTDPALCLSAQDTAAALGVSTRTVYNLIARGDLPAITVGSRKLVPRQAVDLVIERAMDGFDPDRLLGSLADEEDPSGPSEDRPRRPGVSTPGRSRLRRDAAPLQRSPAVTRRPA